MMLVPGYENKMMVSGPKGRTMECPACKDQRYVESFLACFACHGTGQIYDNRPRVSNMPDADDAPADGKGVRACCEGSDPTACCRVDVRPPAEVMSRYTV